MTLKHTHLYKRVMFGFGSKKYPVYKCEIAPCTHHIIDMEMMIGRMSRCWGENKTCPNEIEMTRHLVMNCKIKWPKCEQCKAKRQKDVDAVNEVLNTIRLKNIERFDKILGEDNEHEYDE